MRSSAAYTSRNSTESALGITTLRHRRPPSVVTAHVAACPPTHTTCALTALTSWSNAVVPLVCWATITGDARGVGSAPRAPGAPEHPSALPSAVTAPSRANGCHRRGARAMQRRILTRTARRMRMERNLTPCLVARHPSRAISIALPSTTLRPAMRRIGFPAASFVAAITVLAFPNDEAALIDSATTALEGS